MSDTLREIDVLALDCQAGGATPAHGDLLELGWAVCAASGPVRPVQRHWIVPRSRRPIRRAIRELTGWSEACLADAVDERQAWLALFEDAGRLATHRAGARVPTVIHFARFELAFLRDLHERLGEPGDFPFDAICLHSIALRLFPDLPRRNIRALAGYLGHSPELMRRSAGHVEATAFIWRALVPRLEEARITTWGELKSWLERTPAGARRTHRVFPFTKEQRRALPDRSGVYRFVRSNGDVLYVGKALSLKKRVASHFKPRGPSTERALEFLTQAHAVVHTETASLLEAALLECDEIKRIDPPYNVQFRSEDHNAWFASRDFGQAVPAPDHEHPIGPLPSQRALLPLWALIALAGGARPSSALRASALAVPSAFLPDDGLFADGFTRFVEATMSADEPNAARRVLCASRALFIQRGRTERDAATKDAPPDFWDLARVLRRLERSLVQTGLLVRRARLLAWIVDADLAFRERDAPEARALCVSRGDVIDRQTLPSVLAIDDFPARRFPPLGERQLSFDKSCYDRMRVLLTELRRVIDDGGDVALRIGKRTFAGERLIRLMRMA